MKTKNDLSPMSVPPPIKPVDNKPFPVRVTAPFKLKDKPGRGGKIFPLMQTFGFMPEVVIVQKVRDDHDMFRLAAVLTPAELLKEQQLKDNLVTNKDQDDKKSGKENPPVAQGPEQVNPGTPGGGDSSKK